VRVFSRRTDFDLNPNELTLQRRRMVEAGREVLDLTVSNPTRAGFKFPSLSFREAMAHEGALLYDPSPFGLLETRRTVASLYAERGIEVSEADLVLTASTSEAYSYLFRLLADPGQTILVPRPSYPLFQYLCALDSTVAVTYPLAYSDEWHIDLGELQRLSTLHRPKAILLVHPNNPTGSYVKADEWARIERIAQACGAALICDEVFFDYRLSDLPVPDAARPGAVPTFVLNGLSKLLALPQVKLSWILVSAPESFRNAVRPRLELIADTFLSVNAMVQHALPDLLELRAPILQQIRRRLLHNLAALKEQTDDTLIRALAVEGGWYAVLRLPASRSDDEWATRILEQGVFIHPGNLFSFDRPGFLVVSLLPEEEVFTQGIERLAAVVTTDA